MKFSFAFTDNEAHELASDWVRRDSCEFELSSTYRFYYQFFRPVMPIAIRQLLQRNRKVETHGDWFIPSDSMRLIADRLKSEEFWTNHLWPDESDFGFVLTHDVETAEGMRHISRIADREQSMGFRSSWNLIPYKYKIDMGLVKDLQARGFEIGIHGYNHDGRLYCSQKVFEARAVAINKAIRKYGAVGFRSPMVHRNLEWLQSLDIEYDASCFDIDPYQAGPGGVGSIWPFIAGKFVELPYTMPQDHTLFVARGEIDDRIWREKLKFLARHQGLVLMLTHPDYLTGRKEHDIYIQFLEHVNSVGNFWHATPMDVARWWRKREQANTFGNSADATHSDKPRLLS